MLESRNGITHPNQCIVQVRYKQMLRDKFRWTNLLSIETRLGEVCQVLILEGLFQALLAPTGALVVMIVYYIYIRPLFQIFTQSIDAIDVTSVTLSRLNSINAIDILGIF